MTYLPKVYKDQGGDRQVIASGGAQKIESGGSVQFESGSAIRESSLVRNVRTRLTIAEVNAGATLVAAATGYKHRLVDARVAAIGGNVGAVTTIDILGTQTTAQKLVTFAQANLTDDTLLKIGDTGVSILDNGVSFIANDSGTAITIGKTGDAITTATHVDVFLSYVTEAA